MLLAWRRAPEGARAESASRWRRAQRAIDLRARRITAATDALAGKDFRAFWESALEYPRESRALRMSDWPPAAGAAATPMSAPSLPRSSSNRRSAVFLPIPGTWV